MRKLTRLSSQRCSSLPNQYFQFQLPIERRIFLLNRRLSFPFLPKFFNASTTITSGLVLITSLTTSLILCFKALLALSLPLEPCLHLLTHSMFCLISVPSCSPVEREAKAFIPVSIPIHFLPSFFDPVSVSKTN